LFFENGVEHTTMDQIAKAAEASTRNVYNHFTTKDTLFEAILTRMVEHLNQDDELRFSHKVAIDIQLTKIAQQEVSLLNSVHFLRIAKIAFMQMLQQPVLAEDIASNQFGCMRYLESFLRQTVANNKLQIEDIEFAAKQFVYQLKSFVFYPVLFGFETPDSLPVKKIIEQTFAAFLSRYQAK
tara:strand:- start:1429 stop:1974 length:546 start_codon:yes stop_codon:yes gene_type:complete